MRRARLILVALSLAGCAGLGMQSSDNAAVADVKNAAGQPVGTARFTQAGSVVRILVEAKGLPPGPHAVHVHAVGKCDPPDFATAGPHFNPLNKQHGALNPQGSHAGDLPNITVAPDGTGRMETPPSSSRSARARCRCGTPTAARSSSTPTPTTSRPIRRATRATASRAACSSRHRPANPPAPRQPPAGAARRRCSPRAAG